MHKPDHDQIVMGRDDFDEVLESAAKKQIELKDTSPIEIQLQCAKHTGSGSLVHYDDGLVLVTCSVCGARSAQIEVAGRARRWGRMFSD